MIKAFCCVLLAAAVVPSRAAEQEDLRNTPVLWKGVEVVTNDFESIERVRSSTPLRANTLLPLSDPKLRITCDAVRNKFPSSRIRCSNVIEPSKQGPPEGWYLVEVDIPQRVPLRCLPGARLDPRLAAMSEQWLQAIGKSVLTGTGSAERLNDRNHLDYANAELSAIAARLHAATRERTVEIEAGAVSCNPQERMHSLYLMNFTGDPQRFITMAAVHVNDDHAGAANAATRFLAVFAEFIGLQDVPHVAKEACKSVLDGDFTARQKSLYLLIELQKSGAITFAQHTPACQQQIRNIARTSLALPAKVLLE